MNRAFLPFVKSLFVALLAVSSIASASEEKKAVKADPAKGEAIFAATCIGCHGVAGNSMIPTNPKLSGQHEAYIYKQLNNFKTPDRMNPVMIAFASTLSDDDMKNVAAYLSAQVAQPGAAKDKDIVEIGKKIYRGGIADKNVAACAGCHSPNGAGIPAQFPRLAGQHQDYTIAQLTNFRNGTRKNSPQMVAIAKRMSDDEIKAVADYVAGLK